MTEVETGDTHDNEIIRWARNTLTSLGYALNSKYPENVQHTPWSHVIRFETATGHIYLKKTPPALVLEASIIQTLREEFHAPVPTIIVSNAKLHCFLMKDAGISLREILKQQFDASLLTRAIKQFTSLQLSVSEHADKLLKIGVPDWQLEKFPDLYREVVANKELLLYDGLLENEINELAALTPIIQNWCEALSAYQIKQTIVQPDFNDNNSLYNGNSQEITIIDLGEIVISHPFFSLLNCLHQINKHYAIAPNSSTYIKIKDTCFSPYLHDNSNEDLSGAIKISRKLWIVYNILAQHRLIAACRKETIMPALQGRLCNSFKELNYSVKS